LTAEAGVRLRSRKEQTMIARVLIALGMLAGLPALGGAEPLTCNLSGYRAQTGLTAAAEGGALTVTWDGDRQQEVRLRFGLTDGGVTIQTLDARQKGGAWATIAAGIGPDYRVVSGLRRISNQQLTPLRGLGVALTADVIDRFRWEPFWDAPLDMRPTSRGNNPPPAAGIANQPGLPRTPEEVKRAVLVSKVTGCAVKTDGARLEIAFPGVQLGVFTGRLQYTVFRGSNLIQQDVVATTSDPWVAYKYDGGLRGLAAAGARVAWKDIANNWQENRLGGAVNEDMVPLRTSGRVVVAERTGAGSIALFPPPHTYFWAREIAINLGYNFVQKTDATTFAIGIRQHEDEDPSENPANFALFNARPGTEQRMTVFLYPNAAAAPATYDAAMAFTHGDRFKAVPGYVVMGHHYHMNLGQRLGQAGSLNAHIPDLPALKALGINIVSQVDSLFGGGEPTPDGATFLGFPPVSAATREAAARAAAAAAPPGGGGPGGAGPPRRPDPLPTRYNSMEGAKRHSDTDFLVMPSQEYYGSPLGGHTDLLFSHPVYWIGGRAPGQPLVETDPKYGKVYRIGSADDLMTMARQEGVLINMPHPRTKGSTGYPDAVKHLPFFSAPEYHGIGFRWGMGLDRSEQRLCEYRCQPLIDDMNNWIADAPIPAKQILAISEVRYMQPGDDIYSSAPVQYVKLDRLPVGDDHSAVIQALMRGDSFVTSGEVLLPGYAIRGSGARRTIVAEVDYTFPLTFVEVISGDGAKVDRQVISATALPPTGTHRFEIPFDATGKKWVRFAAWDVAGNGAMAQPVKLTSQSSQ
jgi:hypothetical protein